MEDSAELKAKVALFGLSNLEATIYVHLLTQHEQTISEIAKDLNVPRTSVNDNLYKLFEKGLIRKVPGYKKQKFRAANPEILQTVIENKLAEAKKLEKNLEALSTLMRPAAKTSGLEVRYYEGKQGLMQMMWNALEAKKEIVGYSSYGRRQIVGRLFTERLHLEFMRQNIKDRFIMNTDDKVSFIGNKTYLNRYRNIRTVSKSTLSICGDISIYNDVFALSYWHEGKIQGVEIINEAFAQTQRILFSSLWETVNVLQ